MINILIYLLLILLIVALGALLLLAVVYTSSGKEGIKNGIREVKTFNRKLFIKSLHSGLITFFIVPIVFSAIDLFLNFNGYCLTSRGNDECPGIFVIPVILAVIMGLRSVRKTYRQLKNYENQ
ncbi:hypothetical protein HZB78_06460 [Candidatus Collierbacteria bacterium]|nr:hypothetical protein [Candidatus Collierbacteria bacterium]